MYADVRVQTGEAGESGSEGDSEDEVRHTRVNTTQELTYTRTQAKDKATAEYVDDNVIFGGRCVRVCI